MSNDQTKSVITIVSGLPRSGTSMMMKMLLEGGISVLTDSVRGSDEFNPEGYFEFEPVKKLRQGDYFWMDLAIGKAVKVISYLLKYLPQQYSYQIIFMERSLDEILLSQQKMLEGFGKRSLINDEEMKHIFSIHVQNIKRWMDSQPNIRYLLVNYNKLLLCPDEELLIVKDFLSCELDIHKMKEVIKPTLYRSKLYDNFDLCIG